jgi:hypothetical protein
MFIYVKILTNAVNLEIVNWQRINSDNASMSNIKIFQKRFTENPRFPHPLISKSGLDSP